jgi:hypothetical protein
MPLRITVGQTSQTCDIQDCVGPRLFWVARLEYIRGVCGRCMEELVSVCGWRMLGPIAGGHTMQSHASSELP